MASDPTYVSFMVRLWRRDELASETLPAEWQSEIEHIQSGRRWSFERLEDLVGFLRR